ncbi:hypothetical protein BMR86_20070, partial [Stenotrophomonas sp. KAs 5-3]
ETNLGDLQALLAALARGDLSVRMEGELQGVFARTMDGLAGNLPSVTGAKGPRILGAIHLA